MPPRSRVVAGRTAVFACTVSQDTLLHSNDCISDVHRKRLIVFFSLWVAGLIVVFSKFEMCLSPWLFIPFS